VGAPHGRAGGQRPGRRFDPYRPGTNLVRAFFLDPEVRRLHPSWQQLAGPVAATLRAVSAGGDDRVLNELIGELFIKSGDFRRLWAEHDAHRTTGALKRFRHPLVGNLELSREAMTLNGTDHQTLVVYHAEAGSPSEQALRLKASQTATGAARRGSGPGTPVAQGQLN
jgi:hypothetical protein